MVGGAVGASIYMLATASTTSASMLTATTMSTAICAGILGGLIPDIDHPGSKISAKVKPVSKLINLIFSHRGLFHAPLLYIILWIISGFMIEDLALRFLSNAVFAGIVSHLILDALNPTGIPVFFPFSKEKTHLAKIKTGGKFEIVVRVVLVALFLPTTWVLVEQVLKLH